MELDEITYKINGCAMKVHNTLGNGFRSATKGLLLRQRDADGMAGNNSYAAKCQKQDFRIRRI